MKQFIDEGEIELAILRICHMTPGLAPGEGHEYEGPALPRLRHALHRHCPLVCRQ